MESSYQPTRRFELCRYPNLINAADIWGGGMYFLLSFISLIGVRCLMTRILWHKWLFLNLQSLDEDTIHCGTASACLYNDSTQKS